MGRRLGLCRSADCDVYDPRGAAQNVAVMLAPTTPAGHPTQTIAGTALATASTVGLFSGWATDHAGSYRSRLLTPLAVHRLSFSREWAFALLSALHRLLIKRQTTSLVIAAGRFSHTRSARIHKPMRLAALLLITCFTPASEA